MLELKCITRHLYSWRSDASQSYHVGIEILRGVCYTLRGAFLSIVPCWNWNRLLPPLPPFQVLSQSYHVGIEIFIRMVISSSSVGLSIVPCWNWNLYNALGNNENIGLSIVPCWNWNMPSFSATWFSSISQSYHVGIEICLFPFRYAGMPGTLNRTMLELKSVINGIIHDTNKLSIVPCWNWNEAQHVVERNFVVLSIVPCWNWNILTPIRRF